MDKAELFAKGLRAAQEKYKLTDKQLKGILNYMCEDSIMGINTVGLGAFLSKEDK